MNLLKSYENMSKKANTIEEVLEFKKNLLNKLKKNLNMKNYVLNAKI